MTIDVHTHISKLDGTKFSEDYDKNLSYLLDEMKLNSVDRSLLIAGFNDESSLRPNTEEVIGMTKGVSNISIIGSVDILNYDKEYLGKIENWFKNNKIVGIKMYTGYQHFYPTDERCTPIYELCLKYNKPVIFHTGDTLAGAVKNPKLKYAHPLNIDEVASDLPDLKIVVAHMGNPWLIDCAEILYKNPNVYADISGLVVGNELNTPYGAMMRQRIRELINFDSSNFKLMYGTDWPLCPMDIYLEFVKTLEL
ncbi:MAG: amidohydrolase family protein, partial [Candidatus Vogelbacteria bacterium]|nr:amidohydrolase family protein [Candidatus Vogelbacteria bacterium]